MYCDECGEDYENGEDLYHDYYNCLLCGGEYSVRLTRSIRPDDGDIWICEDCDWSAPA